jgi:hypothetical protein
MAGSTNLKTCTMSRQTKPNPAKTANPTVTNPIPRKEQLKQRLLDQHDLLEMFHVTRGTLYNWCRKGFIKVIKLGGKKYFDADDVDDMLEKYKQTVVPGTKKGKAG